MSLKYKRALLKLSGEFLAGGDKLGINNEVVVSICKVIKECVNNGVELGIVVGGGNFWRGRSSKEMDRVRADHIGMLATVMNSLYLCDSLEKLGVEARVQTAISICEIAEPFIKNKAVKDLSKGRVVIFGCGTGSPFFSTDTAAALRAVEIGADIILKATLVDGVYDSDPKVNKDAVKYKKVSFREVLHRKLSVIDSTAASMCMDNDLNLLVFSILEPQNIVDAVFGKDIGTLVTN